MYHQINLLRPSERRDEGFRWRCPESHKFAKKIGADGYADDAMGAVEVARKLIFGNFLYSVKFGGYHVRSGTS